MKRKPLPPTYFNISIILIFLFHYFIGVCDFIKYPYSLLGIVPIVIGIVLNLVADNYFKKSGTTVKPFEESKVLITSGIFGITRNPMYLGMFLILIGISTLLGSVLPFVISCGYVFIITDIFIKEEEKMLDKSFGIQWTDYKNKVRRWI